MSSAFENAVKRLVNKNNDFFVEILPGTDKTKVLVCVEVRSQAIRFCYGGDTVTDAMMNCLVNALTYVLNPAVEENE